MEYKTMHDKIGQAAGQIWQILAKSKEPITLATLPKRADVNAQLAQMALGWLAREGKVKLEEKGKIVFVSLSPSECCCG
jgi:hypothetical protein